MQVHTGRGIREQLFRWHMATLVDTLLQLIVCTTCLIDAVLRRSGVHTGISGMVFVDATRKPSDKLSNEGDHCVVEEQSMKH